MKATDHQDVPVTQPKAKAVRFGQSKFAPASKVGAADDDGEESLSSETEMRRERSREARRRSAGSKKTCAEIDVWKRTKQSDKAEREAMKEEAHLQANPLILDAWGRLNKERNLDLSLGDLTELRRRSPVAKHTDVKKADTGPESDSAGIHWTPDKPTKANPFDYPVLQALDLLPPVRCSREGHGMPLTKQEAEADIAAIRASVPELSASDLSDLLVEAGPARLPNGTRITLPACVRGDACQGKIAPIKGLDHLPVAQRPVMMRFMFAHEVKKLIESKLPFELKRPCRMCIEVAFGKYIMALRHHGNGASVKQGCLNVMYRVDQDNVGGFRGCCVWQASGGLFEGFYDPFPRFDALLLQASKQADGRWKINDSLTHFKEESTTATEGVNLFAATTAPGLTASLWPVAAQPFSAAGSSSTTVPATTRHTEKVGASSLDSVTKQSTVSSSSSSIAMETEIDRRVRELPVSCTVNVKRLPSSSITKRRDGKIFVNVKATGSLKGGAQKASGADSNKAVPGKGGGKKKKKKCHLQRQKESDQVIQANRIHSRLSEDFKASIRASCAHVDSLLYFISKITEHGNPSPHQLHAFKECEWHLKRVLSTDRPSSGSLQTIVSPLNEWPVMALIEHLSKRSGPPGTDTAQGEREQVKWSDVSEVIELYYQKARTFVGGVSCSWSMNSETLRVINSGAREFWTICQLSRVLVLDRALNAVYQIWKGASLEAGVQDEAVSVTTHVDRQIAGLMTATCQEKTEDAQGKQKGGAKSRKKRDHTRIHGDQEKDLAPDYRYPEAKPRGNTARDSVGYTEFSGCVYHLNCLLDSLWHIPYVLFDDVARHMRAKESARVNSQKARARTESEQKAGKDERQDKPPLGPLPVAVTQSFWRACTRDLNSASPEVFSDTNVPFIARFADLYVSTKDRGKNSPVKHMITKADMRRNSRRKFKTVAHRYMELDPWFRHYMECIIMCGVLGNYRGVLRRKPVRRFSLTERFSLYHLAKVRPAADEFFRWLVTGMEHVSLFMMHMYNVDRIRCLPYLEAHCSSLFNYQRYRLVTEMACNRAQLLLSHCLFRRYPSNASPFMQPDCLSLAPVQGMGNIANVLNAALKQSCENLFLKLVYRRRSADFLRTLKAYTRNIPIVCVESTRVFVSLASQRDIMAENPLKSLVQADLLYQALTQAPTSLYPVILGIILQYITDGKDHGEHPDDITDALRHVRMETEDRDGNDSGDESTAAAGARDAAVANGGGASEARAKLKKTAQEISKQLSVIGVYQRTLDVAMSAIRSMSPNEEFPEKRLFALMPVLGCSPDASELVREIMSYNEDDKKKLKATRLTFMRNAFPFSFSVLQAYAEMWRFHTRLSSHQLPLHYYEAQVRALRERYNITNMSDPIPWFAATILFCHCCDSICQLVRYPQGDTTVVGERLDSDVWDEGTIAMSVKLPTRPDQEPIPYCTGEKMFLAERCGQKPLTKVLVLGRMLFYKGMLLTLCVGRGCAHPCVVDPRVSVYTSDGYLCSVCSVIYVDNGRSWPSINKATDQPVASGVKACHPSTGLSLTASAKQKEVADSNRREREQLYILCDICRDSVTEPVYFELLQSRQAPEADSDDPTAKDAKRNGVIAPPSPIRLFMCGRHSAVNLSHELKNRKVATVINLACGTPEKCKCAYDDKSCTGWITRAYIESVLRTLDNGCGTALVKIRSIRSQAKRMPKGRQHTKRPVKR